MRPQWTLARQSSGGRIIARPISLAARLPRRLGPIETVCGQRETSPKATLLEESGATLAPAEPEFAPQCGRKLPSASKVPPQSQSLAENAAQVAPFLEEWGLKRGSSWAPFELEKGRS